MPNVLVTVLYTTTNAIRAALGTSEKEISDAQITDLGVEDQITLRLISVYPTHAALAVTVEGGGGTDDEKLTYKKLKLYCQYEGACALLPQLQLLTFAKISDGDAEMQRMVTNSLEETIARIRGRRDEFAGDLNPDLVLDSSLAGAALFGRSSPDRNPVIDP